MIDQLVAIGPTAAPAIEAAFTLSRGDAFWRFRLIEVLGRLGARSSEPFLTSILQHDPDLPARAEAARALGRGHYQHAKTALRALATTDPLPPNALLLSVGYALATLGDPIGLEILRARLVVPEAKVDPMPVSPEAALTQVDMRWDQLRPGIWAAGELRLTDLRGRLEEIAKRGGPFVRREAVRALPKLRERAVIPALIAALEDPIPGVRKDALDGLRSLTGHRHKALAEDWRRWWAAEGKN